jgi:tryptophanyl-tRNA synthetase
MRERRALYEKPGVLDEILRAGTARAKREAEATMALVRQAMKIDYWERWR